MATCRPTVKELGFTVLAEGGADPELDIVFIHGLQGNPHHTWTYNPAQETHSATNLSQPQHRSRLSRLLGRIKHDESYSPPIVATSSVVEQPPACEIYWPFDLLSTDFPRVRVATFGYDSKITHWFKGPAMHLDIFSYGEALLNGLEARRRADPTRPLIFVVHSLGGLVLKDALRRAKGAIEERFKAVYASVKAIIFFGTPHRGGSYVNLGSTVAKIVACGGLGFDTVSTNLRDLRFDSNVAKMLREEFAKMLDERKPRIYTLQEAMGLTGFGPLSGKVVEDSSSALDFAFEQKDYIGANHVNMCRFSGPEDDGYCKVKDFLSLCIDSLESEAQEGKSSLRQKILASLHIPETQDRCDQVEIPFDKTCEWIFNESHGFTKWLESGNGMFWIQGKPGSGKSTLMKFIVSDDRTQQHLYKNNASHTLLMASFFFSNRGQAIQKSLLGLYHHILYQLLSQAEFLTPLVELIFEGQYETQGKWVLTYLESALLNIVQHCKHPITICLFIDALDEHEEGYAINHERLVGSLQKLVHNASNTVKVMLCLSSRPETYFKDSLHSWPSITIHEHTRLDVETYVEGRFKSYLWSRPDLTSSANAVSTLSSVSANIISRAQGVFLWVKLITTDLIEGLMDGESPTTIEDRLLSLPGNGDLQELYRLILVRLSPTYMREAYMMLQIAYSTIQILPLAEFFQAVDFLDRKTTDLDEEIMERRLNSRCRGFLEIQPGSWQDEINVPRKGRVVQFLHQSVRDYLTTTSSFASIRSKLGFSPSDQSQNGHVYLLKYRTSRHLAQYEDNPGFLENLPSYDLRKFEVFYQARIVEKLSPALATGPLDALADFVDSNQLAGSYLKIEGWKVPSSWKPSFLALAVQAGLLAFVERNLPLQSTTTSGRPLLHYAAVPSPPGLCGYGPLPFVVSTSMIKVLKMRGEDVHGVFEGKTAFTWAFSKAFERGSPTGDQLKMLDILLAEGSDPNFPIPTPPSRKRIGFGNLHIEEQFRETTTALCIAVRNSEKSVTNLLLRWRAGLADMAVEDWNSFEINTPPLSLWNAFRSSSGLQANEMKAFNSHYHNDEDAQNHNKLLRMYPGQLTLRITEQKKREGQLWADKRIDVLVVDHELINQLEPFARQYLKLYDKEDFIKPGLPKPLKKCSHSTQSRVLSQWASPHKPVHYF